MAIVDRIRKLVALSHSDNVNEAAQAAAMAQKLMMEHKVELADLELSGQKVAVEEVVEDTVEGDAGRSGRANRWRINLACYLAKAFNSKVYFTYRSNHIGIIGHKSDCQTVQYLQQYFGLEIERLCAQGWEQVKADAAQAEKEDGFARELPRATVWKNNFRDGAVHAIGSRMKREADKNKIRMGESLGDMYSKSTGKKSEYQEQLEAEIAAEAAAQPLVASNQAMVLVREQEQQAQTRVNSAWDNRFTKPNGKSRLRHSSWKATRYNSSGYDAGKAAGNSIPLSNARGAIGGSKPRLEG